MKKHMKITKSIISVMCVLCSLAIASCTSATEKEADRCLNVPSDIKTSIVEGLNTEGITIAKSQAVKSKDYKSAYIISIELDGPGLEEKGDIAVLTTNRLENGGGIFMSVDDVAKEFFVFPDASESDAKMTISADGVDESRKCIG